MSNLLWPGDHRAGELLSDAWLVEAMVTVEVTWLDALVAAGIAPAGARSGLAFAGTRPGATANTHGGEGCGERPNGLELAGLVEAIAGEAGEAAGNPVVALVTGLRARLPEPAATWLHRGLTSQDVLDTALMLGVRDVFATLEVALRQQISCMTSFVRQHRGTPMLARTLTQPAIPTTVGVRAAGWLAGFLDAADRLGAARPLVAAQLGGAAGTMAAVAELAHGRGMSDPAGVAAALVESVTERLGLASSPPWHVSRGRVTAIGEALVTCTDAWGRLANDVLIGSRTEIGELRESLADGRGGSSTMPGKHNPVLAVLLRRAAIAAPPLAATLHLAAAGANDDRPDGAWHAEWDTLRTLARRTLTAASQATELSAGLRADPVAMARNLAAAMPAAGAEQRAMAALTGSAASDSYYGAADLIIDRILGRAAGYLRRAEGARPMGGKALGGSPVDAKPLDGRAESAC